MNIEFMEKALSIAQKSGKDIPVGAVIVKDGSIIGYAHNEKEAANDVTAHAEILAIRNASKELNSWRLSGCDIYVTLEPCPMCMWAILQSRLDNLYFGSFDTLYGALSTLPQMTEISYSKIKHKGGIMEQECGELLKHYFDKMRDR